MSIVRSDVTRTVVAGRLGRPDLVVLDPARQGAGRAVMAALVVLDAAAPSGMAYVSCDPASFARDLAVALGGRMVAGVAAGLRPVPHDRARRIGRILQPPVIV